MRRALTLVLIMILCCVPTMAADFHVSPAGSDRNPGTKEKPFKTIQKAADSMQDGDTCLIRKGTYRESIRPANSGKPGQPIVFRSLPGERPVIHGADPVTDWTRDKKNTWKAPIDWDLGRHNQIFLNNRSGFEARWPSKKNSDPLDWEAARYGRGSTNTYIVCKYLPNVPADYWKGAVVWILAGFKWTAWSTTVTGNKAGEKKIHLGPLPRYAGSIGKNMSPAHKNGGVFYLTAIKAQMNAPNEWFLDTEAKTLYLCLKPDQDPAKMRIEAKRRDWAFDLNQRDHIHISGLKIMGAGIRMEESNHCRLADLRMYWIAHTRGGNTGYGLNENLGISVDGRHNTIRDSEIAYSAGSGIIMKGYRNSVINCWIHHTDYAGSYDAPVRVRGWETLISHNTIHDTGRDCIQPHGQANIVEYNNIFNMGRICHDLGATYVNSLNGEGTEYRYNWIHDNRAHGHQMGLYLDNFCSFHLIHHNVTWNNGWGDIQLNKPCLYNIVINNTILGKTCNWGRWKTDWMYGSAYINNAVRGRIQSHPQLVMKNNLTGKAADGLNRKNFRNFTAGAGKGMAVPGITRSGKSYVGAYAPGETWKPGHDFDNPPNPEYRLSDTPLRNLVRHGSFRSIQYGKRLGPWTPIGAKSAQVIRGKGNIVVSYTERNSIIGNSVQLNAKSPDGISQEITGLRPEQEYEAGAWIKAPKATFVTLEVTGIADKPCSAKTAKNTGWQYIRVRMTTGRNPGRATLSLIKTGPGAAFIDDISLIGLVPGMKPRKPGPLR